MRMILLIQRWIALFFILLLPLPAFSLEEGNWALDINLTSIHQDSRYNDGQKVDQKYNKNNFGLGASYGYSDNIAFKLGYFNNSYNRTTKYVAAVWQKKYYYKSLGISPGIGVFILTGYDSAPEFANKFQPGAMPSISLSYKNVALNMGLFPSARSKNVLSFQLQIGF